MNSYRKIYWLPISMFSVMAIIHNTYLAKETANLHTGLPWLDWTMAAVLATGIESALWALIIHRKVRAVKAYAVMLLLLNLVYYGRAGKLNTIISLIHPEAWLYLEGIITAVIFSLLLSGFLWYLTEVAIADITKEEQQQDAPAVPLQQPADLIRIAGWQQFKRTQKPLAPTIVEPLKPFNSVSSPLRETVTRKETVTESPQSDPDKQKRCIKCESLFEAKRSHAVFCSNACKQAYYRLQEKETA